MNEIIIPIAIFLAILLLTMAVDMFFIVNQQQIAIIERFGKFKGTASAGMNFKIPLIDVIKTKINLRIQQIDVSVETKTIDNVFVSIIASVQFKIAENKIFESFYTLENPNHQMQAYIFDVIRAKIPQMTLDEVFSEKDKIANEVQKELKVEMGEFGINIIKALVTDIHPDSKVKKAMNEINEAHRLRLAAVEKAEAEKITTIKAAEAQSRSKVLQGEGIAGQRKAIIEGLKESLDELQQQMGGNTKPKEAMLLLLMSQYFDTLKDMGSHGKNTIFMPHSPSGMEQIFEQLQTTIISANEVKSS